MYYETAIIDGVRDIITFEGCKDDSRAKPGEIGAIRLTAKLLAAFSTVAAIAYRYHFKILFLLFLNVKLPKLFDFGPYSLKETYSCYITINPIYSIVQTNSFYNFYFIFHYLIQSSRESILYP